LDFSAYLNEKNPNIDDKALNCMALGYLGQVKELNLVKKNINHKIQIERDRDKHIVNV